MEVLTAVNPYIHGSVLAISVVIETYVFIQLWFKLDRAAILIALSYLLVMVVRTVPVLESVDVFIILWPIASNIIWLLLYYFIFEMRSVYIKLTSQSHQDNRLREKKNRKTRNIFLWIFFITYMTPAVTTYYIVIKQNELYKDNFKLFFGIILASRLIKCF